VSSNVLHQLRRLAGPLGRGAALWLLLFALLPLARAAWAPAQNPSLNWDQVCVASIDGTPHVMAASVGLTGDLTGDLGHLGPDCQLCPQCVLGTLALPVTELGQSTLRPTSQAPIRAALAVPASRPARHGAQPRAPPRA
jgi:hypothetical protein